VFKSSISRSVSPPGTAPTVWPLSAHNTCKIARGF
jgi:hypothetical protein